MVGRPGEEVKHIENVVRFLKTVRDAANKASRRYLYVVPKERHGRGQVEFVRVDYRPGSYHEVIMAGATDDELAVIAEKLFNNPTERHEA